MKYYSDLVGPIATCTVHVIGSYTVSYNANGGKDAPSSQTKTPGTNLTLSNTTPTHDSSSAGSYTVSLDPHGGSVSPSTLTAERTTNYSFKNWNTKADGSGTSYYPGEAYTADENATLYAQWNSSTSTSSVMLPTPKCDGYVFKGWSVNSGATSGTGGMYTPTGNVTLHAIWEAAGHTVSYNANGGLGVPASQTKTPGTNLTLSYLTPTHASSNAGSYTVTLNANGGSVSPSTLTAARTTNYSFKNWNTKADGSGTSYYPGSVYSIDADVTLYAQWNSSTSTSPVMLPTPKLDGYAFKGWATSIGSKTVITGSYTPTRNVTLFAIWQSADFVLPASLVTIEDEAFAGGAFSYVQLSESVSVIRSRAFANCPNLRYIYIPDATGTIAKDAFDGASGLTILGHSGSYAEFYADKNGFDFIPVQ